MDKIKVMYVINGATKADCLTGTDPSIQRTGSVVTIDFPHADGCFLTRWSKEPKVPQTGLSAVSYAQCEWLARSPMESDTATEVS